jgi:hypothetical protein
VGASGEKATKRRKQNDDLLQADETSTTATSTPAPSPSVNSTQTSPGAALTGSEIADTMNPPSQRGDPAEVSPEHAKAVLELHNERVVKKVDEKNKTRTTTLLKVWPNCKFVDYDSRQGTRVRELMKKVFAKSATSFDSLWPNLKKQINDILRNQRGCVLQQMKARFFGECAETIIQDRVFVQSHTTPHSFVGC